MGSDELWKSLSQYNSPQLLVALAIVCIIAVSVFLRFYLAPGTARLAESSNDRKDAVGILQTQLALCQKENEGLDHRNRQLETSNNGFEWMKNNPAMLRALADQLEHDAASRMEIQRRDEGATD